MIKGLPVLDAHIHLDPKGTPVEAVTRFKEAGGSHLIVVHKPYHHLSETTSEEYERSFQTTIEMCDLARRNDILAWCVVGPYPGSLPYLAKKVGLEEAESIQMTALETAFDLVDEGTVLGIGEVGRVHFRVDDETQNACDRILKKAMTGASVRTCPVILHTESHGDNPDLYRHIAELADLAGLPRHRVVKHYSGWEGAVPEIGLGISISMQARKKNIEVALEKGLDFLLETDYIDEKERPDVVMPPDTVPKKISWAYRKGIIDREIHLRLMVDIPRDVLGIETKED